MYTNANITSGITFPFIIPFASFYKPTASGCPDWVLLSADGVLVVAEAGVYRADAVLML